MIQTALKVTGIDHVVLHVRDLPRARHFYIDVLGMTVAHENDRQCFLHCGNGQQIALFLSRDDADIHAGSEMNHMALRLESGEYEEVKARLEAEGCTISGLQSSSMGFPVYRRIGYRHAFSYVQWVSGGVRS